jgi:integrase/recombinase XerD
MNLNLNEYQNWLEKRLLSSETIQIKLRHVRKYGNRDLTTDNIVDFLKENSQYSPYHLENLRSSLLSYAKFLKVENEIEWDIIARVIPKTQPKLFPTINYQELNQLKGAKNLKHKTNNDERDNLILDFFLDTGLRISELVSIKHCHYQDNQLKVLGKNNKYRFIPVSEFLVKNFKPNSQDYLFQTKTGKSLHVSQVRRMIYQRRIKAGLTKHVSPHTFRRSFATLLDKGEVRLTIIQKLLGHNDINTTGGYIHNSYEEAAKELNRAWKLNNNITNIH